MRIGVVCACALACGLVACGYDYEALKAGAATSGKPGTAAAGGINAADLGATTSNFLGRSQFTVDQYFSG